MRPVGEVLRAAARRIDPAEARLLLAHVAGVPAVRLLTLPGVSADQQARLAELVAARRAGTPVQYLTGRAAFRHVEVEVGPGVFIPRPETEVLAGWALDRLRERDVPARVVELCAGSGAVSLTIAAECPGHEQYAVELDEAAAGYAERNLAGSGVRFVPGDMADAFPELNGTVDLIIANPPYVPLEAYDGIPAEVREHEPQLALFSGQDGLDALRVVAVVAARLLKAGGWVGAEHAEVQAESAPALFVRHGAFDHVRDHPDLTDRPRFLTARRAATVAGWPS